MGKHVYQVENAVAKYDRSHGFVDLQGKEFPKVSEFRTTIINYIYSLIENDDTSSVSVLDVGVGHGKWLFIPLILRLLKANKLKCAIGIDNSDKMLSHLKENLLAEDISTVTLEMPNINNISANAGASSPFVYSMHYDIEELVYNCTLSEVKADKMPKVDILLLMGVLHHTINWRQTLHVIVDSFLRTGSYIILSERDCESDYIDGNFYQQFNSTENKKCKDPEKSEWCKIWRQYYELRAKEDAPWNPEISVSDITPVLHSLYNGGFNLIGGKPFYERWKVKHDYSEISNWLNEPVFANFFRSLSSASIKKIAAKITEKDLGSISVNEGWKFYILRKAI